MIIIKIGEGLGNQLFQYSLGRNLEISNNTDVKLDMSWFEQHQERNYKLGNFNVIENIATPQEIKKLKRYQKKGGKLATLHDLFLADESIYIKEKQFNFDPAILAFRENAYLHGVWHTEKYFKQVADTIRDEITLKKQPSKYFNKVAEEMSKTNSVSLHIRRGDFLTMKKAIDTIGILPIDYYYAAEKKIEEEIKNPTFFVFSDDIAWVKDNLKLHFPMVFVSNGTMPDYEELVLMSKCKHNIIANSSFSWWGAWLNNNPQKIIIAPSKWFRDSSRNAEDMTPESWIRI